MVLDLGKYCVEFVAEPLYSYRRCIRLSCTFIYGPTADKPVCIPYLVAEIPALLHLGLVKEDVVSCGCAEQHAQADSVGTVFGYELKRVRRISESLGHLASLLVAYDSGEINIAERYFVHEFVSCHYHPCHPEEEDIRSCHKVVGRIVVCKVPVRLCLRMSGLVSVKDRNRPQP